MHFHEKIKIKYLKSSSSVDITFGSLTIAAAEDTASPLASTFEAAKLEEEAPVK